MADTPAELLGRLVKALRAYRQGVVKRTFPAFAELVTPELVDKAPWADHLRWVEQGYPIDQRGPALAVVQQAADFVAATRRAMDMRGRTHRDYIKDQQGASSFQDTYEAQRLKRFERDEF